MANEFVKPELVAAVLAVDVTRMYDWVKNPESMHRADPWMRWRGVYEPWHWEVF
jgi:hypothetical protein